MDTRIKKLWVDALRSGEYRQARKQLRCFDNGFCCLGVLCNLHAIEHPEIAAGQTDPWQYLGEGGYLPIEVRDWADVPPSFGSEGRYSFTNGTQRSLAADNDSGKTFAEIADIIEAKF